MVAEGHYEDGPGSRADHGWGMVMVRDPRLMISAALTAGLTAMPGPTVSTEPPPAPTRGRTSHRGTRTSPRSTGPRSSTRYARDRGREQCRGGPTVTSGHRPLPPAVPATAVRRDERVVAKRPAM